MKIIHDVKYFYYFIIVFDFIDIFLKYQSELKNLNYIKHWLLMVVKGTLMQI